MKWDTPKFDTVLLHSNWSSLRRKYWSKIPTNMNVLSCGPKASNISGISDAISSAPHPQNSSQHVRACGAHDGAICSKNRKIVPYHKDSPNTRNGARLRSPSLIMANGNIIILYEDSNDHRSYIHNLSSCWVKALKKFRLWRVSNPWPLQYRCSALSTELSSQLGADHVVSL